MTLVVPIVEGEGEVAAVPVLLRRLAEWMTPNNPSEITYPLKIKRNRFLNRDDEFNRIVSLAARRAGNNGWILILLDADDDCPAELSSNILRKCGHVISHKAVSVVLAKREYEAWFMAASDSLRGFRGFTFDGSLTDDPEAKRDAKRWMGERMEKGYNPVVDQPAFSAKLDLVQASEKSRSFRKLCSEWRKQTRASAESQQR